EELHHQAPSRGQRPRWERLAQGPGPGADWDRSPRPPSRAAGGLEGLLGRQDDLRDLDQLAVLVAGQLLQPTKGRGLVEPGLLHQDALGFLDDLAIFQRLLEVGRLLAERLELLEAMH